MSSSTRIATTLAALALALAPAAPARAYDCVGPPPAAEPGTADWQAREAGEATCGEQRVSDTAANPAFHAAALANTARDGGVYMGDPFRDPSGPAGTRFRYERTSFDPDGRQLDARLFHPPPSRRPPYPGVVVVHGGGADQEMY